MRRLSTNSHTPGVVRDEQRISPALTFCRYQKSLKGTGSLWRPALLLDVTPDLAWTEGQAPVATIRRIGSYARWGSMYYLEMWRRESSGKVTTMKGSYGPTGWTYAPVTEDALPNAVKGYFATEQQAVDFMLAIAPEFFK